MASPDPGLVLFECSSCGRLELETRKTCCGQQMAPVEATPAFDSPETASLVENVYGISETELAVCHAVMTAGETTVREVADELDRDQSGVNRHLGHLVELGLVERRPRQLPEGGRKYVYSAVPMERVRRQLRIGLYGWLVEATELVDDLSREKIEAMVEAGADTEAEGRSDPGGVDDDASPTGEGPRSATDESRRRSWVSRLLERHLFR